MLNRILAAGAVLTLSAGMASAAVVYAGTVIDATPGTNIKANQPSSRYVQANALGAEDESFYSLGLGGEITLGFGRTFSGSHTITAYEVNYDINPNYGESIDVFALLGGAATLVGSLVNFDTQTGAGLNYTGTFDSLRFVDTTSTVFANSPSFDGFDLDAVGVEIAPVPLPAAGLLLFSGLAGVAGFRRLRRG